MTVLLKLALFAHRFPISGGKTNGDDARRWTDVIIKRVGVFTYYYYYCFIILLS